MTPSLEAPPPQKIIHYPIHGDLNGGTLILLGDKKAKQVVFLMGGFPDDHKPFLDLATNLAKHGCLVGVTCLPGYDRTEPWIKFPKGFSVEEVVAACGGALYALVAQSAVDLDDRELTCVFHDWGSVFGLVQVNRILEDQVPSLRPKQVVLLDVCGPPHPDVAAMMKERNGNMTVWNTVKTMVYRVFFASCFALQTHVSHVLAQAVYSIGSLALFQVLPFNPVGPLDNAMLFQRHPPLAPRKLIWMMYPYYYMFKQSSVFSQFYVPKPDDMKVLFMYGVDKNAQFHTPGTIQYFDEQTESKAIAVEGAGHWLFLQRPEFCLKAVMDFCFGSEK